MRKIPNNIKEKRTFGKYLIDEERKKDIHVEEYFNDQ
jgi:hypothetical protein